MGLTPTLPPTWQDPREQGRGACGQVALPLGDQHVNGPGPCTHPAGLPWSTEAHLRNLGLEGPA